MIYCLLIAYRHLNRHSNRHFLSVTYHFGLYPNLSSVLIKSEIQNRGCNSFDSSFANNAVVVYSMAEILINQNHLSLLYAKTIFVLNLEIRSVFN